jgi:signal transduction histidine kinase/pSer/pThr/pTyr-binding forkhead associated (FHA) protein/ActR/RegA family two-component response regulator
MSKLFFLSGPEKGETHDLKEEVIFVGRAPDNHIQIKERHVSRRHLKIVQKGEKYFIEDLRSTNGTYIRDKQINAGKVFEVREGVPIGIGNVFFSLGKEYKRDIASLQKFVDPSNPLNDTVETDRPKTSLRNLELIYSVSKMLMQSLDLSDLFEKILDQIFELLKRIDRGAILLVDPRSGKITRVISRSKDDSKHGARPYSRTVVNKVLKEGKAVMMSNTMREDKDDRSVSMELMKIKSVMCVPLMSKSKIRGAIYVDSVSKPYGFRKEDLSLLSALSSPAAIAIENATLYSNLESLVEDRTKVLMETQEKLRESEVRFKAIFDHMSSGVMVFRTVNDGEDFTILNLNRAFRKIENIDDKEIIGNKTLFQILPFYKGSDILESFRRVWRTANPESGSITFHEGEEITGWREYYIYRLPSGEIVAIFDNVTEKKKAEREQKALQEQLLVAQKMESIGAFAGGIAHNFRNILQAISGNTEYMELVCGEKPDIADLTTNIFDSVEKGVDLINNLLHFSRRGGGYQMVHLDLADVIKQTHEIIARVLNRNIEIVLSLDKDLFVKGNRSLLSQVFMNLYINANDAMPNGGKLTVEAKRKGNKVTAVVSDTGIGMDEKTVERIFDPFFTLKEVGKGTGLGLSTVHGIVQEHKGDISVSSKPGKGANFRISFSYAAPETTEMGEPAREIIPGRGEKVLIVDDEKPALDALTAVCKKLGYEAIPVERPLDALQNYSEWDPDVVLMDRGMPKMDGVTCARKIVEIDPDARIIMVSGYEESGPNGIDESTKRLIKGYITKPCGIGELSQAISRALAA